MIVCGAQCVMCLFNSSDFFLFRVRGSALLHAARATMVVRRSNIIFFWFFFLSGTGGRGTKNRNQCSSAGREMEACGLRNTLGFNLPEA